VHERYRQTDGRRITYSEREREFTFAKKGNQANPYIKNQYIHGTPKSM